MIFYKYKELPVDGNLEILAIAAILWLGAAIFLVPYGYTSYFNTYLNADGK